MQLVAEKFICEINEKNSELFFLRRWARKYSHFQKSLRSPLENTIVYFVFICFFSYLPKSYLTFDVTRLWLPELVESFIKNYFILFVNASCQPRVFPGRRCLWWIRQLQVQCSECSCQASHPSDQRMAPEENPVVVFDLHESCMYYEVHSYLLHPTWCECHSLSGLLVRIFLVDW